jgi:dTMP kinase
VYRPVVAVGRLITIEGIDGAGKSTLAGALHARLLAEGLSVTLLREPGSEPLAERIRALVQAPDWGGDDAPRTVAPRAEALLYAAARAQLVAQRIKPLLCSGGWILLDRFVDSSLAYQGGGRGLGIEAIAAINAFATEGIAPDRTLLLDCPPAQARKRIGERPIDRLEGEGEQFFAAVAAAYDRLARQEPARVRRLDALRPPDQLLQDALQELSDLLPASARRRGER